MKSASKSYDLDPIPTNIIKASLDILIKPITTIINLSLESGTFPLSFKEAHVTPYERNQTFLLITSKIIDHYNPM